MPSPQEQIAILDDDATDPHDFAGSVPLEVADEDRRQPEGSNAIARTNMDMGRFVTGVVLLAVEIEAIRTKTEDRGHAHLADHVGGDPSMSFDAYLGLDRKSVV
jgi:hypothetical protein